MDNIAAIARPYANAAFDFAHAKKALASWNDTLELAATVANDPRVQELFSNPRCTPEQLAELFIDLCADTAEKRNFIRLLAKNHRLAALPAIAALYKELREAAEKTIPVTLTSVIPMDAAYQEKFSKALMARLKRNITLELKTDPSILGGALIQVGDMVIDGSLRGKLTRLLESMA